MELQRTFFLDIDGTILKHRSGVAGIYEEEAEILPGVAEKLQEWHDHGDIIILTTARLPSMREHTIKELEQAHIYYHQLIMGCGRGERVVINDCKPARPIAALAFTVERDEGLGNITI
jgi:hydroxymethylpyrimidine pyrophosphatase-like HAD family hydrolase